MMVLLFVVACASADANCGNEVSIMCDPDGTDCYCETGPMADTSCSIADEDEAEDDYCDTICAYCDAGEAAGPPSVLLGQQ